jgi:UDP-N-acetylmuramoyl-tripeptide--D-alanyl-D-alanine ligase
MKGEFVVILGDMYELGDNSLKFHSDIISSALKYGFKKVFLTGSVMKTAKESFKNAPELFYFEEFEELRSAFLSEAEKSINIAVKGSRKMALEKLTEGDHAE